ncbi:cytochrome P450 6a2-like [Xylocopa sonorina]|uniref:cytochrome P450 6a2-like n=1 Tax=Xylocopa sonorina TaxID=1818115 RepID=UPI00403A89FD
MASAFCTLVAGALVLLCFYLYTKFTYWKRHGIPTAKGYYPFVGHMLPVLMARKHAFDVITQASIDNKDRSMVGFYKGFKPVLIVRETELIKSVLQSNFSSFHENGLKIEPEVDPLLAKNPFFTYGEAWIAGRKRLTYAFSNTRLKILFASITNVLKKFDNFLERRLRSNNRYEVELKYLFSKFTAEVVANAGIGVEGFCFEEKEHAVSFDKIGDSIFKPPFIQGVLSQLIILFPGVNKLCKFPFVQKDIDQFFRKIVTENLEIRRKETTPRNDFLQLMLDLEKSGEALDIEATAAYVFSFFMDGYETSSATLNLTGHLLAANPAVQEKLRNEVKSTIEKHGGELTYEALKEMTYMDQVLKESQRYYSVVGFLSKVCTEEFELQGSDGLSYRAKPGSEIYIPVYALHRDPKYWSNADVFDPERFSDERKQTIEKMAFIPFGEGPRMCVGMRMAWVQMKACLAGLLRSYKLELSPKTKLPLKFSATALVATPIGGCWVYISKL